MKQLNFFILLFTISFAHAQLDTIALKQEINDKIEESTKAYNSSKYAESQALNQEILRLAESIKDSASLQIGYRFLAYDFLVSQDTLQARIAIEKSIEYAKSATNKIELAETYAVLASIYENTKQPFKKTLNEYNKAIKIYKEEKDSIGLGYIYLNITESCIKYEKFDLVRIYIDKSKPFIEKFLPEDLGFYYSQCAMYYLSQKDYSNAETYLKKAETLNTENQNPSDKEKNLYLKAEIYFGKGEFKKAYETLDQASDLYQKNLRNVHTEEIQKIAATFEVEQYKKEAAVNERNNQLQKELLASNSKINTFLIIISALSFLVIGFLFVGFKNRKKLIKKLEAKNREHLEAKEESERLAASKSDFFNTVSHELRTPLYGVIGMSALLLDDPEIPNKNKENLKTLKFSADYLLALVNDVLQLGKIDAKKIPLESSLINIKALTNSLLATFEYSKNQNKNHFFINIKDDVPTVFKGNSMILKQVLMNLIGNATKFTENGTITIDIKLASSTNNDVLEFAIIDNGPGIPENKQKEIFAEFAQLKDANAYYGTGLGLTIVTKLLNLLNSEINLTSEVGKGSTFSFKFPFEHTNETEAQTSELPHLLDDKTFYGKNILVVDDNRINQVVTSKILDKLKVNCTIASDGEEAVQIVQKNNFDLILMDVNMPILNGFEATKQIRTLGYEMPILALTAVEADDVRLQSVECGMNGYIIKPYDIVDFKRTVAVNLISYIKD